MKDPCGKDANAFSKKKKRKIKVKEKEKKKQNEKRIKIPMLCLETRARSEAIWRKHLKPGALNLYRLGATDLVLATWVERWI